MATISENLIELQTTKANIKAAIESKGQDLTDVPFTQYADKINEISVGGGEEDTLYAILTDTLTSCSVPSGVTEIKQYLFADLTNLVSINLPNTVTKIGSYAFSKCKGLQNFDFPSSLTTIMGYAFEYCSSLTHVIIPKNVTNISQNVFAYCSNLESVVFEDYSVLTTLSSNMLRECTKLKDFVIPYNVTTIPNSMFNNCKGLTNLKIPKGVTKIDTYAFYYCSNILKYDFTECTQVPTLSNKNAFQLINANCKIYVPDALYDEWVAATNWATYASYIAKASEMV